MEYATYTPIRLEPLLAALEASDLSPSPAVNRLFRDLVAGVLAEDVALPGDSRVYERCRALCARGESRMEHYWAERCRFNPSDIEQFPYLENYAELAQYEAAAITRLYPAAVHARWAMLGAGPLPLSTAFLRSLLPSASFVNVDHDAAAIEAGRVFLDGIGHGEAVSHHVGDAGEFDAGDCQVVLLAALVGADEDEKSAIIDRLGATMRPGSILACRSVPSGPRELLYPRFDGRPAGFTFLGETAAHLSVINNLMLFKRNDD